MLSRRELLLLASVPAAGARPESKLDRRGVVHRHDPVVQSVDARSPLSVGNGELAFTADCSGLQTFPQLYERTIPLCTQAQWGWHTSPLPAGLDPSQFRMEMFDTYGREVGYPTSAKGQERLFAWLRENPHRLNLARISLLVDGRRPALEHVSRIEQRLDLWAGSLASRFLLGGRPVAVRTACHPAEDVLGISIESPLLAGGRLCVAIEFPYGSPAMDASDWSAPDRHRTTVERQSASTLRIDRALDRDRYTVDLEWAGAARAILDRPHRVVLRASGTNIDLSCRFTPRSSTVAVPSADAVRRASAEWWSRFWSTGGAIDFSASMDARAPELERRVVLSQYLTAVQCAGSSPPQETGLTCNSWYGKFHLEMHWWHAAHFARWGRAHLLERSLGWYSRILPGARERARRQGYAGTRWPKMTSLDGRESPSPIGPLLIWQQPHPILYAEACYRAHPDRATLDRYRDLVLASADFLASYAVERGRRYILGPPVIPAQENHPPRETWNPTFELAYWRQALGIAQTWRERLGLGRSTRWEQIRERLSELPVRDGVYLADENCPQTFTERNRDHPSMLYALGMLDGEGVDRETMRRTLRKVLDVWRWETTWGWDYPAVAMTAARLGEMKTAVDVLFMDTPKNRWLANGHNYQRPDLPVYLPANGGLLMAVAAMAGKFPKPGWKVRYEGLQDRSPALLVAGVSAFPA
jgi:hypothetical protein